MYANYVMMKGWAMNHDWNFEPDDDECETCGSEGLDECICGDTHEPDTIDEYLGE